MGVEGEAKHRIEKSEGGVSVLTVTVGGRELSFETGKVGRLASGAVMARDGETVVYSTACTDRVSRSDAANAGGVGGERGVPARTREREDTRDRVEAYVDRGRFGVQIITGRVSRARS